MMLSRMTYGQLGVGALAVTAMLLKVGQKQDLLTGWNRLWLVGAALGFGAIALQAFRKWRFDSTDR